MDASKRLAAIEHTLLHLPYTGRNGDFLHAPAAAETFIIYLRHRVRDADMLQIDAAPAESERQFLDLTEDFDGVHAAEFKAVCAQFLDVLWYYDVLQRLTNAESAISPLGDAGRKVE
mgnify:FL=1